MGGEANPSAGDEVPSPGEPGVRLHEVLSRDAVAVAEHENVTPGLRDRAVQDSTLPKPVVLLPEVGDREAGGRPQLFDPDTRRRAGSIVGDNHLEITVRLRPIAAQREFQFVRRVVRTEYDGN